VLPTALLIAAHIKPRSKCTEDERRDFVNNVIPMCLLGCDALFELRFLVVADGKVHVKKNLVTTDKLKALCDHLDGLSTMHGSEVAFRTFVGMQDKEIGG
jgi:hypothetical protein